MPLDWSPLWLSLRYAGVSTLLALAPALLLAWLLDAVVSLDIFLPPVVFVYYLLSAAGIWRLRFNWDAAVVISAVSMLPVLVRLMGTALDRVDRRFENAARVLGAGEWRTFWRITLPLAWRGLLAAAAIGFVRAFADFDLTLIVARRASLAFLLPLALFAAADIARRVRRRQVAA